VTTTAVNAHTHIYSGLAPLGMPPPRKEPKTFVQILEEVWWRLDRALDEDSLRASARLYVAESLLFGTTALIDHHESPGFIAGSLDVLADVCQELGMRALVCYGATERNGGLAEARRGLEECRRFLRDNQRPLVRGAVALHASFTVSDDVISEAAGLCRELGSVLHLHVAEDAADVDDARARGYGGVIDRLDELGALIEGSIFAHGVHLSEGEVRRVAERGIWLVQNPRSNRGNRVGYPRALGASDRVALGTDGYPADMAEEHRALLDLAAEHEADGDQASARLSAGHRLVAERFGTGAEVQADQSASALTVGGRVVVRDGVLMTGDIDEIRARAREQAPRLFERMSRL
jgi:cytosine/adenosine deaminase-related metal-dependent hydrolase